MYFDFEDYRPDIPTLDRSLTQLEIVLLTVVVHLLVIISILAWPNLARGPERSPVVAHAEAGRCSP